MPLKLKPAFEYARPFRIFLPGFGGERPAHDHAHGAKLQNSVLKVVFRINNPRNELRLSIASHFREHFQPGGIGAKIDTFRRHRLLMQNHILFQARFGIRKKQVTLDSIKSIRVKHLVGCHQSTNAAFEHRQCGAICAIHIAQQGRAAFNALPIGGDDGDDTLGDIDWEKNLMLPISCRNAPIR